MAGVRARARQTSRSLMKTSKAVIAILCKARPLAVLPFTHTGIPPLRRRSGGPDEHAHLRDRARRRIHSGWRRWLLPITHPRGRAAPASGAWLRPGTGPVAREHGAQH